MAYGDSFAMYIYSDDTWYSWQVKLSAAVAAAGGFSLVPPLATNPVWPYGAKHLRHVLGVCFDNGKACYERLPIASPGDSAIDIGTAWTNSKSGREYQPLSFSPEKKSVRDVS
jgi:hypothetical protein